MEIIMTKVITYGSYDLLHYGHIRLLERAKALGDYLIVGVTSDDYDKIRGKINLQQSLMERVEAVRATGIADEIIIEEYEGQKIDDIRKYDVDIFTVGSDWAGYFDYLNEYCKVIYLPRTEGVSSSEIREQKRSLKLGMVGDADFLNKVWTESKSVNGIHVESVYTSNPDILINAAKKDVSFITDDFDILLNAVDAVYIRSLPKYHYEHIGKALDAEKHVLCESPLTLSTAQAKKLLDLADKNGLILMEAIKTAYSTAYERLLLLIKAGKIGDVISIDSTCTSLREIDKEHDWNSIYEWGPTALLPILQVAGTNYKDCKIATHFREDGIDTFTKINLLYDHTVASIQVGDGFKAEGNLIISGSKGYIYVPAPWWKTDYYEVRYEDQSQNKRYFYQLDGEGIRYELVAFARAIERGKLIPDISREVTCKIAEIMEHFENKDNMAII